MRMSLSASFNHETFGFHLLFNVYRFFLSERLIRMLDNRFCSLYIKQLSLRTSIDGDEEEEPECLE